MSLEFSTQPQDESRPGQPANHSLPPLAPLELIDDASPEQQRDAAEDESQYPRGLTKFLIIASVTLVYVLTSMDSSIVSVVVPSLTDEFHTIRDVGWYSAAYRLCVCSFQFMFGKLYKTYPPKKIFLSSVALFMVGSVVCATAKKSAVFVLGRAVCGFAASAIMAGGLTLLVLCLPMRKRPLYTGIVGGVSGVSGVASPMLGGAIVDGLGWRWCFWISLPLGFITLLALFFCLPNTKSEQKLIWRERLSQMDPIGTLCFVASLTCLFLALSWAGSRYAWRSPLIIGLLVASGILLGLFGLDQWWKGEAATLPPRILKNRSVLSGFTYTMFCNSATMVVLYYLPTYFQVVRGKTAAQSGYYQIPAIAGDIIGVVLQSTGVTLIGYYTPFMWAGTILMPLLAGLLTTIKTRTALVNILVMTGFFGFSGGIGFLSPQSAVQMALPKEDASIGLSIIIFAEQFGAALFVSAAQNVFQTCLAGNLHVMAPSLNTTSIESAGLTDLRNLVTPEDVKGVLDAVDQSVAQTWYIAVALSCLTIIGSATMDWRSVKEKKS
ncbi:MFS transporter [Aureobasidium subglaciale]|nr:MFS transporter [Aureobasidium subglaciale]